MANKNRLLSIFMFFLAVTACGGGGDSGSGAPTNPTNPTNPTTPTNTLDDEFGLWLSDLSEKVILTGYQGLEQSAEAMLGASESFCALSSPVSSNLNDLRGSWSELNASWQQIQWLKVGPIVEQSRLFRMQFWPDANDAVGRGVDNLLLEPSITVELVAQQNVGAQGIPALEYLLFAASTDSLLSAADKDKRCDAVQSIAGNIKNMATDVYTGWQASGGNYTGQLTQGTGDFTSRKDAVEEVVTNWLEQIEKVKDEKMLKPLADAAPGLPNIAEFALSQDSLASVKLNLASFAAIYSAGDGHGFDDILKDHLEQTSLADNMQAKLDAAIASAGGLQGDYADLLNDEAARTTIAETIQAVREVRDLLTADFVQTLDINIGFNSNDGD